MASVCLREMTAVEHAAVQKLAHSHTGPAQSVQRAQIIWRASHGESAAAIAILRSLALSGRRFETWEEIVDAIHCSTVYWNAHRHPFVWGQRRRHRPRRSPGIALLPRAA